MAHAELTAQALAAHGVPGYVPQHGADGGECVAVLHETPVIVRYVLTLWAGRERAEVEQISINGAAIPAAYFDADTLAELGRDCERSREAAGWSL